MKRLFATIGLGATLLAGACSGDEQLPTGMNPAVQPAAKPPAGLKVTPSQLNLSGIGAIATITASSSAGSISVAVSNPACVAVSPKTQKNQSKFTVTATASGSCTLTVTDGASGNVQVPVTVTVTPTLLRSTLAAGFFHTCGLDATGAAYCWGKNDYGQLGNSSNLGIIAANPTPGAVGGGVTFASLTAGGHHTCGLTPAGAAYCWGANGNGQLGNTTNSGSDEVNPTPLPVAGNLTFSVLVAGEDHTCGITTQGVMYCWGNNLLGQLGTATNNNTALPNPTPTPVDGSLSFGRVAAGSGHTCGLDTSGVVYCWGHNLMGQLGSADGVGAVIPHPTPTAVQGAPALASVAAGRFYTCALTAAGAAWCWGDNSTGQLGATTPDINQPSPVAVGGGLSFVSLGAGAGHTCGLTSGGTAYCWGQNVAGQLGNTTNFMTDVWSYSPLAVSGSSLAAIAIGGNHGCGLTAAGQGWCWGDNRYGQLGTTTNNNTGVGVPIAEAVIGGLTFATP